MKRIILTLAVAVMAANFGTPAIALEGPGRALVASDTARLNAITLRSGTLVAKEFIVPYAGVIRVRWQAIRAGNPNALVALSVTSSIDKCGGSVTATSFATSMC